LLEGKQRTEKRSGVTIDQLRIAGGGSQSDAAMQLTADVFGLPVSRPHLYEASGYETALKEMTRPGQTFMPDMRTHAIYRELYEQVYLRMYKRLQPFYKTMQGLALPK